MNPLSFGFQPCLPNAGLKIIIMIRVSGGGEYVPMVIICKKFKKCLPEPIILVFIYPCSPKIRNGGCPKNPEFLIFRRGPVIEN